MLGYVNVSQVSRLIAFVSVPTFCMLILYHQSYSLGTTSWATQNHRTTVSKCFIHIVITSPLFIPIISDSFISTFGIRVVARQKNKHTDPHGQCENKLHTSEACQCFPTSYVCNRYIIYYTYVIYNVVPRLCSWLCFQFFPE